MNGAPGIRGAFRRLISRNVAEMFARNTVVGSAVFAVDLMLLWALVEVFAMSKLVAAATGFLIASSLHYIAGRGWIFKGSNRHVVSGYLYFLISAGVGLAITLLMFAAFIRWTNIDYLLARVIVSLFAGLATFLLNAILIFRRL